MNALPRILVIDDDSELLLTTSLCLQEAGYHIIVADNGIDGLHMAEAHLPELVLVTTALPVMRGTEFCLRLKGDQNLSKCLCVVLSTQTESKKDIICLPHCADGVIVRPIPNYEFLSRIETFLRMQKYMVAPNTFQEQSILTAVVENTGTSVWAVDQQCRLLFANSVFREECRTGLGKEIALGETVLLEFLPVTEREEWGNYYVRALQGEQYHFERRRKYSLATFWNEYHCGPIISPDEHSTGAVMVAHDITERKMAEEALRCWAEELAALQANVLEITVQHELPDLLQTIVERATQLLGAKSGGLYLCDPEKRNVRCVVSYNTLRDFTGTVLAYGEGAAGTVAETGEPLIIDDYRIWKKRASVYENEQPFTTLLSVPMLWQKQVTGVIHILDDVESRRFTGHDLALLTLFASHAAIAVENTRLFEAAQNEISERVRIMEALRESEETFATVFKSVLGAVRVFSVLDGSTVEINDSFSLITGYSRDEVFDKTPGELGLWVNPDVSARVFSMLQSDGFIRDFEEDFIHKSGEVRNGLLSADIITIQGKKYFITTVYDITERKQVEKALKTYSEQLEGMVEERTRALKDTQEQLVRREKMAVLGQLAGGVGHELRNPLGAIKNAAYFLKMTLNDPDAGTLRILEILDKEVRTADRIIASLLDFARTRPPVRHLVNINDVVKETVACVPLPTSPVVEVSLQLHKNLPLILADSDQLTQVFSNLVLNGVQAMPDGGQLIIKTDVVSANWVSISVTDTGTGITEENLEKLFEPLFTTKPRGVGLGLVVVKTLVEGHQGNIMVESLMGKGSTFTVNFPLEDTLRIKGEA